jgi:hypothetical protein
VRFRWVLALCAAGCSSFEAAPDVGPTDAAPADAGVEAANGADATTGGDAGGQQHHLHTSFDDPAPPDFPFGWTTSQPLAAVDPDFILDTTEAKSTPRSLRVKSSAQDRYLAQTLGDANGFVLTASVWLETYGTSASGAPRLFDVVCDAGFGIYVRLAGGNTIRIVDTDKNQSDAVDIAPGAWSGVSFFLAGMTATVTVGTTPKVLTTKRPCVNPTLRVGVLPGAGETADVRYDDLDVRWVTSQ